MTTFTGPLRVKAGISDSGISWQVDASGTASFGEQLGIVIEASGTAKFNGPGTIVLASGGVPNIRNVSGGTVVWSQEVTIVAQTSAGAPVAINIPSGSRILEVFIDVEEPFAAGAMVTAFNAVVFLGGQASAANTISDVMVSASARYDMIIRDEAGAAMDLLRNVTSTVHSYVSARSLATAATAGQAMLRVVYVY